MLLYNLATHKGSEKEKAQNATLDAVAYSPAAGIFKIFGVPK
jgi:hypothetical protein